jgi:acyl-CoA thioester hydrolase
VTAHRFPVRVYFEDTDAGGIAYHASYLRWAERGRTEALRDMGLPHSSLIERHGLFLVVRRIEVQYLRPARLDSELAVETRVRSVGGASVTLRQTVVEDGATCADLRVELVCVRQAGLKPGAIPAPWREALRAAMVEE